MKGTDVDSSEQCPTCHRDVKELVNGVCEKCDFIESTPPTRLNRISMDVRELREGEDQ